MGSVQLAQELQLDARGNGVGTVMINGLEHPVSGPVFNLFDLLHALRAEVQHLQRAQGLPLPPAALAEVLAVGKAASDASLSAIRIDMYHGAKGALHYLNNVDKDPQYRRLGRSLRPLLFPSWQFQGVARNVYTLTLLLDPTHGPSLPSLAVLGDLFHRGFPVRISVLPVARADVSVPRTSPEARPLTYSLPQPAPCALPLAWWLASVLHQTCTDRRPLAPR
jgi:hypothetical protein